MDIARMDWGAPSTVVVPVVPPEQAAENRGVVQAVKAVNASEMFGADQELTYQLDQRTGRLVVRIVSRQTKEVLSQIPAEYILRLAEDLKTR